YGCRRWRSRPLELSPAGGVVGREKPMRGLGAVGRGGHSQRVEQLVEVHPDPGRERAEPGDAAGLRELRFGGQASWLCPPGFGAVAASNMVPITVEGDTRW